MKSPPVKVGESESRIPSLGREDLLEEEMANHSSILPGKPHGRRSLAGYRLWDRRARHDWINLARTHGREQSLRVAVLWGFMATGRPGGP